MVKSADEEVWTKVVAIVIAIVSALGLTVAYVGRWSGLIETENKLERDALQDVSRKLDDKILPRLNDHDIELRDHKVRIESLERK